jgi:hypothetical protein
MDWTVRPTALKSLRRQKQAPAYDFVEQSVNDGSAYCIGNDGYFVVAPEASLLPRFVVELRLPQLAVIEEYKELCARLNDLSSGFMWFDSSEIDAYDFAWRLRLPLRIGAPLFVWSNKDQELSAQQSEASSLKVVVRPATHSDRQKATELFTSFPLWLGGQTKLAVMGHLEEGRLLAIEVGEKLVGSAILIPQKDGYVSANVALGPDHRNQGIAEAFGRTIGTQLSSEKKTLVGSMINNNPASFRAALRLGMRIAKTSYTAQLGSF